MNQSPAYDALLLISFGGPEGPDEVIPFLENVLRGKPVPRERLLEVAEHYQHFGGVSPINEHNRQLMAALTQELQQHGIELPIYWGNRNWHPMLEDTMQQMADQGIQRALAIATSAFSSYSGCRQYWEDIARARGAVGSAAPEVDKVRVFFNHPGFIEAQTERVRTALDQIPAERRDAASLVFTAHSIPVSMANQCDYQVQLEDASRLVTSGLAHHGPRELVYQSRSGPPTQPWLEPDVCDFLRELHAKGVQDVVLVPIGFLSDHMEVMFDLDVEATELAAEIGVNLVRAGTVGNHPRFVAGLRELIEERLYDQPQRVAVGSLPARPDTCLEGCCPLVRRPRPE